MNQSIGYLREGPGVPPLAVQERRLRSRGYNGLCIESVEPGGEIGGGLLALIARLKPRDIVVVERLAVLGTSPEAISTAICELGQAQLALKALDDHVDTSKAGGRMITRMAKALATARVTSDMLPKLDTLGTSTPTKTGRPRAMTEEQVSLALRLHNEGKSLTSIARLLGVSRPTVTSALNRAAASSPKQ